MLAADGELPHRRAAQVQAHLAACWSCRTRMKEIESAIADFIHWHRASDPELPPADGPRALLKARLAQMAAEPHPPRWFGRVRSAMMWTRPAYIGAVILGLVLVGVIAHRVVADRTNEPRESAGWLFPRRDLVLPDHRLTPGATVRLSTEELCSAGDVDRSHTVDASLARETFRLYGIRPQPGAYEVDYLITPALGGADDVRNLWPQPYSTGIWNSRHKDALEDHLQQLVCTNRLSLAIAQHDIAANWIAAYKKYFQTEVPIPEHVAFVKDQAWRD